MSTSQFGPPQILVSVDTAAQLIGLSRSKLYELLAENAIRSLKVGRRRLIEVKSLKQWQAALPANEGLTLTAGGAR